jgi:hypothetical protein
MMYEAGHLNDLSLRKIADMFGMSSRATAMRDLRAVERVIEMRDDLAKKLGVQMGRAYTMRRLRHQRDSARADLATIKRVLRDAPLRWRAEDDEDEDE